jgi:hypothetical protein
MTEGTALVEIITPHDLTEHRALIEALASMNSWKAKELLGITPRDEFTPVTKVDVAGRFCCADIATLEALEAGYSGSS